MRFACAGVLHNTKPSHIVAVEQPRGPKPQLDYAAIKSSAVKSPGEFSQRDPSLRRPVPGPLDPAELEAPLSARKYSYKPDTALEDLFPAGDSTHEFIQTSINHPAAVEEPQKHRRTKSGRSLGQTVNTDAEDRSKDTKRQGSRETSDSTPQTDVTEYPWSTSTAPTSAGVTPARASKRASAHIQVEPEPTAVKNDISAIEWMRKELDKRRKQQQTPSHSRQPSRPENFDTCPPSRPRSRARSITNSIKEYIRPGTSEGPSRDPSRSPSRAASRASHRTGTSERERSPSTRGGWRSWGLSRKDEVVGDLSRSNSRGRSESRKGGTSKPGVNLNRELPPLPSLQTWKGAAPAETLAHVAHARSPTQSSKKSMQLDGRGRPRASTAASEKDEIVAARLGAPMAKSKPEVYQPTRPHKPASQGNLMAVSPTAVARTTDPDREARNRDRDFGPEDLIPSNPMDIRAHTRNTSTTSTDHPPLSVGLRNAPASQASFDHYASVHGRNRSVNFSRVTSPGEPPSGMKELASSAPSFSQHRKYEKRDIPPAINSNTTKRLDSRHRHVLNTNNTFSPPPVPPKDDKKSWWHLKAKQKKPTNWMDQIEKLGVKDGVLVNNGVVAGSPVIRY